MGKGATATRPSRSCHSVLTGFDGEPYTRAVSPPRKKAASWEEAARAAAGERAQREAEKLWGGRSRDVSPFNYRWEHVESVVRIADLLAERLGADREVVRAAAWLHDLAKDRIAEAVEDSDDHGEKGAELASQVLQGTDFPSEKIGAVAEAIRKHVGLVREDAVEPLEAAILWDADKLSKLGLEATVQFVATRPSVSPGFTVREFWEWGERWLGLASRMAASMNTDAGRDMAESRYRAQLAFYQQLAEELGVAND